MRIYHSMEEIFNDSLADGWEKIPNPRGFTFSPTDNRAEGHITIWGDLKTVCFIASDVVFLTPVMEMHYHKERRIQITLVEDMDIAYYKDEKDTDYARFGMYCYMNNVPIPWFKKYEPNTPQRALTISIMESFFHETNITLSEDTWDRAASVINSRETSLPSLANICRQIKSSQVNGSYFPMYLKGKAVEAVSLLLDYAMEIEYKAYKPMMQKSRIATKEALQILNATFTSPPIISQLAQMVGINKKTLQYAFKQIVGQSIHEYIRALRMQKAIMLLEDTTMNIEDISKAVGYHSKIHFYKAFKKAFGYTPFQMRKVIKV